METDFAKHEYGWLSPTGEWTEAEWGTHEGAAWDILEKKGWLKEYNSWEVLRPFNEAFAREFLVRVKGYVLIDDPDNTGRYSHTNFKPLTKAQRDFLYGYYRSRKNPYYWQVANAVIKE